MKSIVMGPRKIVTGADSLNYLQEISKQRVFIVTGSHSMFANGTIQRILSILHDRDCETYIFSEVSQNPDTKVVLSGLSKMNQFKPEVVIAVGGGSPIDAAKVMALMYEYPNLKIDNIMNVVLPDKRINTQFIAIPSTSGTASEVTKSAVITFSNINLKIGLKSEALIPDVAILDPLITHSMPRKVVAETGMDALTHAVECYINKNTDDFCDALAKEAIYGIVKYLPISFHEKTADSREKMHNYQCLAGLAFSNVGLGAAHGISHAIGGMYNLGHGLLNAIALPYVLYYNCKDEWVNQRVAELSYCLGGDFITIVRNLVKDLEIPLNFKGAGIAGDDFYAKLDVLTDNALKGSTRVNPRAFDAVSMRRLLIDIYEGNV